MDNIAGLTIWKLWFEWLLGQFIYGLCSREQVISVILSPKMLVVISVNKLISLKMDLQKAFL